MARKVILDTNLWSYIGDEGSVHDLRSILAQHECAVMLPPSMLIELLRNPHADSRNKHISAICGIRGRRLASEAQLCAEDFVRVVKRRRHEWLRSVADMATVAKFNYRWTKEWWSWAASDPDGTHSLVMSGYDPSAEIVTVQRDNRANRLRDKFIVDYCDVRVSSEPKEATRAMGGWDGTKTEAWRVDVGSSYWFNMSTSRGRPGYSGPVQTNRDWIGSYIDMRSAIADPVSFATLFLEELTPEEVPRDWMRAAVAYTQTATKIGLGNPRDEQHSAYLVDADIFLSADKRLVDVLNEVRRQAPFSVAEPRVVEIHGAVRKVDAIATALTA
ncbi:hypothetical protein PDG61_16885 [Mycolicibacterium sp. BiH015]|uniref:hypothetical protein n=1 Tax=Mycolicibacterium sp. BiH015 TaxID=3018808 RepID=UPI0022E04B79|nr:hypothetical protein [Mycolicibacterium sp. BiH015]MDA2892598.1 hypothetical protein [Mycolicibacterium sp. BiH015]